MTRNSTITAEHIVASGSPFVSAAGRDVLASGGNAVDATLAMAAMCWLALPGQCGIGGDAFAVVREPDGTVWTVGGSGFGPDGGTPDFYAERGMSAIPIDGAGAVAVPGAMAALRALHERGATRSLAQLWAPSIAAAERGLPCSARTRADILDHQDVLRRDAGAAAAFLPGGRAPHVGERLPQPELAASVRALAARPDAFYDGHFAEQAVEKLTADGAPFSGTEWQLTADPICAPAITGRYGDHVVHETPLPTPGWMVLQQAALCDGVLPGYGWLDTRAVRRLTDAATYAFADRWEHCGSDTDAWQALLAPDAVAAGRAALDADRRRRAPAVSAAGDTTSTIAVDSGGLAVSFIHSLAFVFGARITIPGTGIVLNDRLGRGGYLVPGHPNEVTPRRRPMHTLNAWLTTDLHGRLTHVGNTPGGDGQVQWNMQVLSHLIDHGLDPQEAVSAPRFTVGPGSDAAVIGTEPELVCESRLGESVLADLRAADYPVRVVDAWGAGGSAMVVSLDHERGCLLGGADPRQDGVVLGD